MAAHHSTGANTMCPASEDCAMLSYTDYGWLGSLLNSKTKSSQGHVGTETDDSHVFT